MSRHEIVILGAGPAGLAVAAELTRRGRRPVILDREQAVGSAWRRHYRRLHLHTARELSVLPGLGFEDGVPQYPSRRQFVAYLERYAGHFGLEPRFGIEVSRIDEAEGGWRLELVGDEALEAEVVVLATGYNCVPIEPDWPGQESFSGTIEHSRFYRDGRAWRDRDVLVVGAGNSGAEIALDLAEFGARVALSVRSPQHVVPRDFLGRPSQESSLRLRQLPLPVRDVVAGAVSRLAFGALEPLGLRRPRQGTISRIVSRGKVPLIDVGTIDRIRRGEISVRPGIERFDGEDVVFADGSRGAFDHVVLATGYRSGLGELVPPLAPELGPRGLPEPRSGELLPGLFGLGFDNQPTGVLFEIAQAAPRVAAEVDARLAA